jgi:hypothetical protein
MAYIYNIFTHTYELNIGEALLAYSTSDGEVGLVRVQELLQDNWMDIKDKDDDPIGLEVEIVDAGGQSVVTDNRCTTALAFVEPPDCKVCY